MDKLGGSKDTSQRGSKGVQSYSDLVAQLPKTQREVYNYLTIDFLTPQQISNKRRTSLRAVYHIIKKLQNKSLVSKDYISSQDTSIDARNKGGSSDFRNGDSEIYRLHNQRFSIKILDKTEAYKKLLKIQNKLIRDNNTIQLYDNYIVIYANKDFWGISVDKCFEKSSMYWDRFIKTIENDFNLILIKPRKCVIKDFGCHIAKTNDYLAKEVILNNEKMQVFAPDGKLRLIIDNSFNLKEFEAVHKETAHKDMKRAESFYDDMLTNPECLNLSDITNTLNELIKIQTKTQYQLQETIIGQTNMIKSLELEIKQRQLKQNIISNDNEKSIDIEFESSYLM